MLTPLGYEPVSMREAGINIDIAEDGTTFSENAHIKAKTIYDMTHTPVLADDSGLSIEFLGGAPGIYSARYAGENATNEDRINKVLGELKGVDKPLRNAGENGFGYDPIFMIDDDTSMACLTDEEKNRISHRAKALEKLAAELSKK